MNLPDFKDAFYNVSDYKLTKKKLGSGTFGTVYVILNVLSKKNYAVKIINTDKGFDGKEQMLLMRESMLLHELHHPGIVKFIGINFQSLNDSQKLEPSIITEYLPNGSLKTILDNEKNSIADAEWTPSKKYISLIGIAAAMKYLHEHNIVHRDLKPENILIDENYYPRICDFGLSRCLPNSIEETTRLSMTENVGTPLYMASELIRGDSHYGPGVDVYAFGMLAYEIVTGKEPFYELGKTTSFKLQTKVMKGIRPKLPKNLSKKMKDLLCKCWDENATERPTFAEILSILTSDLSLLDEDIDEDEVMEYIDFLNDEVSGQVVRKETKTQNEQNEYLEELLFRGLDSLLGCKKEMNPVLAASYLKLSSEKGNSIASYILGHLHESGKGVKADFDEAKNYYKKSAEQGNSYGYAKIGASYLYGFSVKKNYSKALKYAQKAANLENVKGMVILGCLYLEGWGVEKNELKGYNYIQKAADLGSLISINNLGLLNENGLGVSKNPNKAFEYYKKAADLGFPMSLNNVANCYKNGVGVKKDYGKAIEFYEEAAELGHPEAFECLGECYEKGIGVEQSYSKAIEYYKKASELGNEEAKEKLRKMNS